MNLRQIIRESINELILDNIISEAIISEAPKGVVRRYANNKRQPQYQNFKQYKNQKNYNNRQQPTTQNKRGTNPYSTSTTAQGKTPYTTSTPTQGQGATTSYTTNTTAQGQGTAQPQGQGTAQPQGQQAQTQQQTAQGQQTQTQQQTAQGQGGTTQGQAQQQTQQQTSGIFKPFLDELQKLVGNRGIDSKPVENNQAAVQHIDKLNSFVFNVIGAIESGNINSSNSPAAGSDTRWRNPYERDKIDAARDISKNAVNYLGNGAENILGQGTDNPLKGVFSAGVKGYNDTNNFFTQVINNRKYANAYNNSRTPNGSGNLTYLMQSINEGCYPRLQTEYHQIGHGIFNATPNVSNCYDILNRLNVELTKYNNSQKQQQGQQAQSQNTSTPPTTSTPTQGNGDNTPQPKEGGNTNGRTSTQQQETRQPNYQNYANELKIIDGDGEKFAQVVEKLEKRGEIQGNQTEYHDFDETTLRQITLVKGVSELSENVIDSIENNDINKLIELMSPIDIHNSVNIDGYYALSYNYNKYGAPGEIVRKTMKVLDKLYDDMKKCNLF